MIKLHASPLQGFTDFRFRNAFQKYFGGIDYYYAPYIRLGGKLEIKNKDLLDIAPENNKGLKLIPQIMTNDPLEFTFVANHVKKLGYKELNWNLGCPYPMVAKRNLGSGLIKDAQRIDRILTDVFSNIDIQISVKIRLGYEQPNEIIGALKVLENHPVKNIAIHPRIGKQLYKEDVDLVAFKETLQYTTHTVIFNGDISSVNELRMLQSRFPQIGHWMIGRGLIADTFLPSMIKADDAHHPPHRIETFSKFHDTLMESYKEQLSGDAHLIIKMHQFWEYFIHSFPQKAKLLKKIKKAKKLSTYQSAVAEILK